MSKLLSYIPLVVLLLAVILLDSSLLKWGLCALLATLVVVSKLWRTKTASSEIEYDERVQANVQVWSTRLLFLMNAVLVLWLLGVSQGLVAVELNLELVIGYLLISLFVPFYVVPLVVKRF